MKVLKIFLVIIILLSIGLFFVGKYSNEISNYINEHFKSDKEDIIEEVSEEIKEEEAIGFINKTYGINYLISRSDKNIEDVNSYIKKLDNSIKLSLILKNINASKRISQDIIEDKAIELYGSSNLIEHKDFEKYIYSKNSREYVYNNDDCDCFYEYNWIDIYAYPIEFIKEDNYYILKVNQLFYDFKNDLGVYKNYNDVFEKNNYIFNIEKLNISEDDFIEYFINNYDLYKEELNTYIFKIIKKDSKISIKSFEIL